jgi:hypothetical protein
MLKEFAMEPSDRILPLLASLLLQSPILLVWLAGFILAVVYWRRHPRVSLFTVIALVIFLVETLVDSYLNLWLPLMLSERGMGAVQLGQFYMIKGFVSAIIGAVAWGLLVAAIFSERRAVTTDNT